MVPYLGNVNASATILIVVASSDITAGTIHATSYALPIPIAPVASGEAPMLARQTPTFTTIRTRARVQPRRAAAQLRFGKRRITAWHPRA